MDGSNVGWWVPLLVACVPLVLLLALYLLARLESWMFEPDERAIRVAKLLEELDGPDEIEQEVTRMLADVADLHTAESPRTRAAPAAPVRTPGTRLHRGRLRRVIAGAEQSDRQSR